MKNHQLKANTKFIPATNHQKKVIRITTYVVLVLLVIAWFMTISEWLHIMDLFSQSLRHYHNLNHVALTNHDVKIMGASAMSAVGLSFFYLPYTAINITFLTKKQPGTELIGIAPLKPKNKQSGDDN
ncbi:hypothetical protein [uncultured Limosilactobacillus sp.]|uniref:hypothetical protein n=1 Tax=uncultured Limosilactobacillus sp. TaxID=2837629 RepID=UPI0025CFA9ED|nr:hypothetical protein [uncultured Limosilactobacillus sp.]